MKRWLAVTVVVVLAALASVGSNIAQASAAPGGPYMASGGSHRGCVNTTLPGCRSQGTIPAGTRLVMHCYINGSTVTGAYTSNKWFYIQTAGGTRNYVHSSRVAGQVSVPHCNTRDGIFAARWASMRVGDSAPTSTAQQNGNGNTEWSGWCYSFVTVAHKLSHGDPPVSAPSAAAAWQHYQSINVDRAWTTSTPASAIRIGSIVFWDEAVADGSGHAAIYVGQGRVITTQGNTGDHLPIAWRSMSALYGGPEGWVPPDDL